MKPPASPQQVIDRLAQRLLKADPPPTRCRLGHEPRRRRAGACSACRTSEEFEIDGAIAQLIASPAFARVKVCPYRVVAGHLVAGLTLGPEAFRVRSLGRPHVDPAVEIRSILKRVRVLLYATGLSRDDIEAISISNDGDSWQGLCAVLAAERALEKALALLGPQIPAKANRSPRGRTGLLHNQAVARAMASAWRQLTGHLPAKDNSKFHELLLAAIASVFGHPVKEPNLESATKTALDRIRKDASSRS
jgi:hypothetical protein